MCEICADDGIDWALKKSNLDAMVGIIGNIIGLSAPIGYPRMTIPAGRIPLKRGGAEIVSLGITGAKFSEEKLLKIGYAFEQATQHRTKTEPIIKPKTELQDVIKH